MAPKKYSLCWRAMDDQKIIVPMERDAAGGLWKYEDGEFKKAHEVVVSTIRTSSISVIHKAL